MRKKLVKPLYVVTAAFLCRHIEKYDQGIKVSYDNLLYEPSNLVMVLRIMFSICVMQ